MTANARPASRAARFPWTTETTAAARIMAAALMLAACGLVTESGEPAATTAGAVPLSPPPAGTAPLSRPSAGRDVATAAPPEKTYPPPSRLAGLGAGEVVALLGPPRLKRRDEPAELWHYRTRTCALDLFLYRKGDGGPYRVRHFEAHRRGEDAVSAAECFTRLLKAQEKRQAG
ncbi:MAG: hypothetical protein ACE5GT_01605 [Rhodospirillales bacterium]